MSTNRRQIATIVLVAIATALMVIGCGKKGEPRDPAAPEAALQLITAGALPEALIAAANATQAHPDKGTAHLALALACYVTGDYERFADERRTAVRLAPAAEMSLWLKSAAPPAANDMRCLIAGIAAELAGDRAGAIAAYQAAGSAQTPIAELCQFNVAALLPSSKYSLAVPKDAPIKIAGIRKIVNGAWVPSNDPEETFTVRSGSLVSRLGECSRSATFGAWSYVVRQTNKSDVVGWACLARDGEVIVPASPLVVGADSSAVKVVAQCEFGLTPFDFAGDYALAVPGQGASAGYPVVPCENGDDYHVFLVAGHDLSVVPDAFQNAKQFFGGESLRANISDGTLSGPVKCGR